MRTFALEATGEAGRGSSLRGRMATNLESRTFDRAHVAIARGNPQDLQPRYRDIATTPCAWHSHEVHVRRRINLNSPSKACSRGKLGRWGAPRPTCRWTPEAAMGTRMGLARGVMSDVGASLLLIPCPAGNEFGAR